MEKEKFQKLLLETAFSCMACDGHIDEREINLMRELHEEKEVFGEVDIKEELNTLVSKINTDGEKFLKTILNNIKQSNISDKEELEIVRTAINIIKSDDDLDYSEIKFFKIIRTKLNISNDKILSVMPDIEQYLEQDIMTDSYMDRLKTDYFNENELPKFSQITSLKDDNLN